MTSLTCTFENKVVLNPSLVCVRLCVPVKERVWFVYTSDEIQGGQGMEASETWQMYNPACIYLSGSL